MSNNSRMQLSLFSHFSQIETKPAVIKNNPVSEKLKQESIRRLEISNKFIEKLKENDIAGKEIEKFLKQNKIGYMRDFELGYLAFVSEEFIMSSEVDLMIQRFKGDVSESPVYTLKVLQMVKMLKTCPECGSNLMRDNKCSYCFF